MYNSIVFLYNRNVLFFFIEMVKIILIINAYLNYCLFKVLYLYIQVYILLFVFKNLRMKFVVQRIIPSQFLLKEVKQAYLLESRTGYFMFFQRTRYFVLIRPLKISNLSHRHFMFMYLVLVYFFNNVCHGRACLKYFSNILPLAEIPIKGKFP